MASFDELDRYLQQRLLELEGHVVGSSNDPLTEAVLMAAYQTGLKMLSRKGLLEYRAMDRPNKKEEAA